MEQELKLSIRDPAALKVLQSHPLLKERLQKPQLLAADYYDTPDFQLSRHQVGLRVRREGAQALQTLKAKGQVQGGLHQRLEWEMPVARDELDLPALATAVSDDADVSRLLKKAGKALQPHFQVKVQRQTADVEFDKSLIEVALDEGEILASGGIAVIREVELELKRGQPQALFSLALELGKEIALLPETQSKAQRGYALSGFSPPPAQKRGRLGQAPLHEVLTQILVRCLEEVASCADDFIAEQEPGEALHKMRVATRRLRSALKSFSHWAPAPDALQEGLRGLSRLCGSARDWEVLERQTLPALDQALRRELDSAGLDRFLQAVSEASSRARRQAKDAVASPSLGGMLLGVQACLLDLAKQPDLQVPAEPAVRHLLKDLRRKLEKRAAGVSRADATRLHRLRLAGKQNRYAHELLAGMLGKRRNRRYIAQLVQVQDTLGRMNDLGVARELIRQIDGKDIVQVRQFVLGFLAAGVETSARSKKLKKHLRTLLGLPRPRLRH